MFSGLFYKYEKLVFRLVSVNIHGEKDNTADFSSVQMVDMKCRIISVCGATSVTDKMYKS